MANANLIDTLTAPSGLLQDKNWDPRGLLSSITTRDSASTVLKNFTYGLNSLGQRTTITREDSAVLTLGYDARRQVTSGQKTTVGSTFPAYDFSYAFDEIGNRKSAGTAAQPAATTYGRNALNQYTAITQAALTLNPTYDLNGSTLNDGRNVSTWDQRNQRRSVTQTSTSEQLFCKFDALGRRTEEQELSSTSSELRKTRFLYDGWNCVAEFAVTPVTAALVRKKTHTWGLDLSQTPQGAGGVGGLLATVDEAAAKAVYTFAYDGNGNVAALYSNSFGLAASYEYDPFGKTISASGPYATENKYRFSTKPQDRIGGLYYYGYRYYDPVTGRWPSRDPIGQRGGMNLYGFVRNDGLNRIDFLGLRPPDVQLKNCTIAVYGGHGLAIPPENDGVKNPDSFDGSDVPINIQCPPCSAATVIACNANKICNVNNVIPGAPLTDGSPLELDPVEPENSFCPQFARAVEAAKEHAKTICNKTPACCKKVKVQAELLGRAKGMCKSTVGKSGYKGWIYDCDSETLVEGD